MLKDQIKNAEIEALAAFKAAQNGKELYDAKVKFLGKQGAFSLFMREFGKLPPAEKPAMGQYINEVKTRLEDNYSQIEKALKLKAFSETVEKERLDLTLPGTHSAEGARHPVSMVINEIVTILSRIGYSVRQGPLIETDRNNFTALNIPEDHPARDLQDTFYINDGHVLRTHTNPVQIRTM